MLPHRPRWAAAGVAGAVLTLAACALHRYDIQAPTLSCDQANRFAYQTLELMEFHPTQFDLAAPGRDGELRARRARGDETLDVIVHIECAGAGASFTPRTQGWFGGGAEFERAFSMTFTAVASGEKRDRSEGGLVVRLQPIPGLAAKLDFNVDLADADVLPVRVSIDNRTGRPYVFSASDFVLIGNDGSRVPPLPIDEVVALVGARGASGMAVERLRAQWLDADSVEAHQQISGFLFYPLGTYERGRAVLQDRDSEETEGVAVEFQ